MSVFFAFSFWAIIPGWFLRPHYYQMLFPSAAMIVGWVFGRMSGSSWGKYRQYLLYLCLLLTVTRHFEYFFTKSSSTVMHEKYANSYFHETREIGEWLKANSRPNDVVGMFGNEPQLWFYSQRNAAAGYLYLYPLLEFQPFAVEMTEQYIAQTEAANPRFFIVADYAGEEKDNPITSKMLKTWLPQYLKNYHLRGVMYHKKIKFDCGEWLSETAVVDTSRLVLLQLYERNLSF